MSSDQQPLSIPVQSETIARFAAERGYSIIRTYADEAKSSVLLSGRDAMQQLLRDVTAPARAFDAVLVLDVTRWGRFQDVDEAAYYEYHCRKNGVAVVYVAEAFDRDTSPLAALAKHLKRTMAAEFSRELALKARAGQMYAVNLGFATGTLPCIGYRREAVSSTGETRVLAATERKPHKTDHVRWVLGPQREVEAIRELFEDYAAGSATIAAIVRRLATAGILTSYGKPITLMSIRMLLRNEIVRGAFVWGKRGPRRTVTNIAPLVASVRNETMVPAIIDAATWDAAQTRIHASAARHRPGASRDALVARLRGILPGMPTVTAGALEARGIKKHELRKHFGNLARAIEAATRIADGPGLMIEVPSPQRVGKQLLFDLQALCRSAGLAAKADPRSHVLSLLGAEVKVRLARRQPGFGEMVWQVNQMRSETRGRWLLVMRLNDDGKTGRDFFVLHPAAARVFSGWIGAKSRAALDPFRANDAGELLDKLRAIVTPDFSEGADSHWSG